MLLFNDVVDYLYIVSSWSLTAMGDEPAKWKCSRLQVLASLPDLSSAVWFPKLKFC